jgi:hypothetical protein
VALLVAGDRVAPRADRQPGLSGATGRRRRPQVYPQPVEKPVGYNARDNRCVLENRGLVLHQEIGAKFSRRRRRHVVVVVVVSRARARARSEILGSSVRTEGVSGGWCGAGSPLGPAGCVRGGTARRAVRGGVRGGGSLLGCRGVSAGGVVRCVAVPATVGSVRCWSSPSPHSAHIGGRRSTPASPIGVSPRRPIGNMPPEYMPPQFRPPLIFQSPRR